MATRIGTIVVILATAGTLAFSTVRVGPVGKTSRMPPLKEATGGWGIGQSRDISPEEYAKGDRRAFQGYEMTDRGDFMRSVQEEAQMMKKAELDELMAVSKFAGINLNNPKKRLNKFDPSVLADEDDDIDLSV